MDDTLVALNRESFILTMSTPPPPPPAYQLVSKMSVDSFKGQLLKVLSSGIAMETVTVVLAAADFESLWWTWQKIALSSVA